MLKDYIMLVVRLFKGENVLGELNKGSYFKNGVIVMGAFALVSAFYSSYLANKSYWSDSFDFGGFLVDGLTGTLYGALGWLVFIGAVLLGLLVIKEKADFKEVSSLLGIVAIINFSLGLVGFILSKIDFISGVTYQIEAIVPFLLVMIYFFMKKQEIHKPLIAIIVVIAVATIGFDVVNANPIHLGNDLSDVSGFLDDLFG